MLAGLYKAPTKYAPHINLPAARARANEVLTNMVQSGFMTEGQVIGARRKPASIVERSDTEGPNYFIDYAFEEIKRIAADFPTRTFVAKTTVDLDLQRVAEETIESHLRQFGKEYDASEAAMVVIDHEGAVRALVGGLDYGVSQFNRATVSRRQPGSSFKPFVYASAVENFGFDENTKVIDGPVSTGKWSPQNYSGGYAGAMTLTTALVKSYNTVPVKLYLGRDRLPGLGGKKIEETARKMGVVSPLVLNAPMVLGSNGLTVMEMATSYGAFMTGGMKLDTHAVTQIIDSAGNILYDYRKDRPQPVRALSENTVGVMNRIMAQIPEWGTARRAALDGIRAAGKTGTTSSYRDAWFVGYTGNYVAAVWYGNDDYIGHEEHDRRHRAGHDLAALHDIRAPEHRPLAGSVHRKSASWRHRGKARRARHPGNGAGTAGAASQAAFQGGGADTSRPRAQASRGKARHGEPGGCRRRGAVGGRPLT